MYSAIEVLGTMSLIIVPIPILLILFGADEEHMQKKPADIVILITSIALAAISVICLIATVNNNEVNYSAVVTRQTIDSIKIDPERDKVIWSIGKGIYSEDIDKCQFVIIDQELYDGSDTQSALDKDDLPCCEWHNEVSNASLHAFGKTYYRASGIKEYYIFYIPRAYADKLPNSEIDWNEMFKPR